MRRRGPALLLALLLIVAACGNAGDDAGDTQAGGRQGITDDTIRVGGVAAITNPLGGKYGDTFEGAKAYLDKVNADGGVFGRKIELVAERDDGGLASRDASQVRALVGQDDVFAVLPVATPSFSGGRYLAENDIPTFGWNINAEWALGPTLFGEKGSYLCFDCAEPYLSFLASRSGRSRTGIIAYTAAQSRDCAEGQRNGYKEFGPDAGVDLVFEDSSLSFGFTPGDIANDIDEIRSRGVQFLSTCIDGAGSGRLGRALRESGLDVVQYLPNGYDSDLIQEFAADLEGGYVSAGFFPFEAEDPPEGLRQFLDAMEEQDAEANENSLAGWMNADLFVAGLTEAGKAVTRASLVRTINRMTDYTARGIVPPIDWTIAHEKDGPLDCTATLQVRGGKLVPVFGEPGKPFTCFEEGNEDLANPELR
jgi:branched-chain amino acid transport system substrate-binding protein